MSSKSRRRSILKARNSIGPGDEAEENATEPVELAAATTTYAYTRKSKRVSFSSKPEIQEIPARSEPRRTKSEDPNTTMHSTEETDMEMTFCCYTDENDENVFQCDNEVCAEPEACNVKLGQTISYQSEDMEMTHYLETIANNGHRSTVNVNETFVERFLQASFGGHDTSTNPSANMTFNIPQLTENTEVGNSSSNANINVSQILTNISTAEARIQVLQETTVRNHTIMGNQTMEMTHCPPKTPVMHKAALGHRNMEMTQGQPETPNMCKTLLDNVNMEMTQCAETPLVHKNVIAQRTMEMTRTQLETPIMHKTMFGNQTMDITYFQPETPVMHKTVMGHSNMEMTHCQPETPKMHKTILGNVSMDMTHHQPETPKMHKTLMGNRNMEMTQFQAQTPVSYSNTIENETIELTHHHPETPVFHKTVTGHRHMEMTSVQLETPETYKTLLGNQTMDMTSFQNESPVVHKTIGGSRTMEMSQWEQQTPMYYRAIKDVRNKETPVGNNTTTGYQNMEMTGSVHETPIPGSNYTVTGNSSMDVTNLLSETPAHRSSANSEVYSFAPRYLAQSPGIGNENEADENFDIERFVQEACFGDNVNEDENKSRASYQMESSTHHTTITGSKPMEITKFLQTPSPSHAIVTGSETMDITNFRHSATTQPTQSFRKPSKLPTPTKIKICSNSHYTENMYEISGNLHPVDHTMANEHNVTNIAESHDISAATMRGHESFAVTDHAVIVDKCSGNRNITLEPTKVAYGSHSVTSHDSEENLEEVDMSMTMDDGDRTNTNMNQHTGFTNPSRREIISPKSSPFSKIPRLSLQPSKLKQPVAGIQIKGAEINFPRNAMNLLRNQQQQQQQKRYGKFGSTKTPKRNYMVPIIQKCTTEVQTSPMLMENRDEYEKSTKAQGEILASAKQTSSKVKIPTLTRLPKETRDSSMMHNPRHQETITQSQSPESVTPSEREATTSLSNGKTMNIPPQLVLGPEQAEQTLISKGQSTTPGVEVPTPPFSLENRNTIIVVSPQSEQESLSALGNEQVLTNESPKAVLDKEETGITPLSDENIISDCITATRAEAQSSSEALTQSKNIKEVPTTAGECQTEANKTSEDMEILLSLKIAETSSIFIKNEKGTRFSSVPSTTFMQNSIMPFENEDEIDNFLPGAADVLARGNSPMLLPADVEKSILPIENSFSVAEEVQNSTFLPPADSVDMQNSTFSVETSKLISELPPQVSENGISPVSFPKSSKDVLTPTSQQLEDEIVAGMETASIFDPEISLKICTSDEPMDTAEQNSPEKIDANKIVNSPTSDEDDIFQNSMDVQAKMNTSRVSGESGKTSVEGAKEKEADISQNIFDISHHSGLISDESSASVASVAAVNEVTFRKSRARSADFKAPGHVEPLPEGQPALFCHPVVSMINDYNTFRSVKRYSFFFQIHTALCSMDDKTFAEFETFQSQTTKDNKIPEDMWPIIKFKRSQPKIVFPEASQINLARFMGSSTINETFGHESTFFM